MFGRIAASLLVYAIGGWGTAQAHEFHNAGHPQVAQAEEQPAPQSQPATPPPRATAPKDARAYIIWPSNGAVIDGGKFWVRMGLQNFGVAPAQVRRDNTGHHHLIIDKDLPPLDEPIPNDKSHLHFGGGQTEARVELPPGKHTLQMLLGDADHVPHDPPVMSNKITITVR
jgi:hypothetical protein